MTKRKRFLAGALSFAMMISILPTISPTVSAEGETTKNITLGATALKGGQQSNVYFGNYQQSSITLEEGQTQPEGTVNVDWIESTTATNNGQGPYYSKDPIKWRVLENANGQAFLLSDKNLDVVKYHEDFEAVTWETSTIRSWLNGYGADKNIADTDRDKNTTEDTNGGIDYTNDNFINSAFNDSEQNVIATTDVINSTYDGTPGTKPNPDRSTNGGNDTKDKIFLLSFAEARNTAYFSDDNSRKPTNTDYVYGGTSIVKGDGEANYWWLRSPGHFTDAAACVTKDGGISVTNGSAVTTDFFAVRPAFKLNLSSVLFTSAAKGGKSSTAAVGGGAEIFENADLSTFTDNDGYKLTIKDDSRKFSLKSTDKIVIITTSNDKTVTIEYENAKVNADTVDNEFVSAFIVNNTTNEVVKYIHLAKPTAESGTISFVVPENLPCGEYTLKVFNEQINGDYKTDYASAFVDVPLTYREPHVTFYKSNTDTESYAVVAKGGDMPTNPTNDGYVFDGWETADGTAFTTTSDITADTIVYAKWIEAVTFNVTDTEQVYDGTEKAVTVTPSIDGFTDYTVTYYKLNADENSLADTTADTPNGAGKYLYAISENSDEYGIEHEFIVTDTSLPDDVANYDNVGYLTIAKSTTDFGKPSTLKSYKGDTETTTFTYGDTITVKATPRMTGMASLMSLRSFTAPTSNQMALFLGDTQISDAVNAGVDGTYTMTVNTADKALAIGENTVTAKYVGTENQDDYEESLKITLNKKPLTITEVTATNREYDGTKIVDVTGFELEGIELTVLNGDTVVEDQVSVDTTGVTGTISSPDAGTYTSVSIQDNDLLLTGEHKDYYELKYAETYPTNVTISKMNEDSCWKLINLRYSINGGEYSTDVPRDLIYGDKLKVKFTFDNSEKAVEIPDGTITLSLKDKSDTGNFNENGIAEIEITTPDVFPNAALSVKIEGSKNYEDIQNSRIGEIYIHQKPVSFNVENTEHIYESGKPREITFTPSSLTAQDFKVQYYKVDENNNVLASTTPVTNAIEPGKYLYVIDFATLQLNYTIETDTFVVDEGNNQLPDLTRFGNVGYMYIKSGITGQQTPIYFDEGIVNLQVYDTYTNNLTNENTGAKVTYTSSNENIVTVDENGKITAQAKGTATIKAKSELDKTTPVYASYTVNVGLKTKTLTADSFDVLASEKVYDGTTDVKLTATFKDGVLYDGDNIKVDISGEFVSADAGLQKVIYKITGISGTGAENYVLENGKIEVGSDKTDVSATISKAPVTFICAETTTRIYDGTPQAVDVSAMAKGGVFDSANYKILYAEQSYNESGDVTYGTPTQTAPTNVGIYKIFVELTDDTNYEIAKQPSAILTIKAATQEVFSVEGVPERVYYGDSFTVRAEGATGTVTYSVSDNVDGKDIAQIDGDGNVTISGVGRITISAMSVKDGHTARVAAKTFEAHKRILTPTATATSREYNGETGVEVAIALDNIENGDNITATATGSMINADAGNDKIVYVSGITLSDETNYTLSTTALQTAVNISKIKIESITISASDKKYGEETTADVTEIDGVLPADEGQVEVIGTAEFEDEDAAEDKTVTFRATSLAGSKAGNYYIENDLTATDTATISPVAVNFTIGQKTFVYDGSEKEITLSATDEFNRIFNDYTVKYYSADEETELDSAPSDAGNYKAEIVLNNENYTTTQGMVDVTISEANQDNLVIVGLPGTIEYGDSFVLEAVGGADDGENTEYVWTVKDNADVTLDFEDENDKSKVNVTIGEVVGDRVEISVIKTTDNYEPVDAKVVFVPTAKVVTFDISNLEQTYGAVSDVDVTPDDEDATYDVTYNGSEELPTDAGTYRVKVSANGNYSGMQTATLTIAKATATGTITGINSSYTYGGTDNIAPEVELANGLDINDFDVEIKYAGTGIYVPRDTPPSKVGNYTVVAEIKGDNYEPLTLYENFEIQKKELKVKAKGESRAYGESNPIFELEYEGFANNETKDVLLAEPIATVNANPSSPVGKYPITVSGGSAENYKFSYDNTGELEITGATGTLYITGSTNTAYVNDVFTLHAFIGNSKIDATWASSDDTIATISQSGEVTAKKAGDVIITATVGGNYNAEPATFNLKVKQVGITLTPQNLVTTYTGERQDISFASSDSDFVPVIGENVSVTYAMTTNPAVTEPKQAGTYLVIYRITDDSYTGGGTTTLIINKATVSAKVKNDSKVYGDEYTGYGLELTNRGTLSDSVLASTIDEIEASVTYASEGAAKTAPVRDGGYEIIPTLSKTETDNVRFTVEKGILTVQKAPLTVTVKDVTREYGAENPTLDVEYTGFKNDETKDVLSGTLSLVYDDSITTETAVGSYPGKTTARGLEAANYDITYVQGDVEITKIAVTASAGTSRSTYLTIKLDKPIEGLTATNFEVKNGDEVIALTEVTPSDGNKAYTLKGTFDTSVTYTVTTTFEDATRKITSEPLSIKPTKSGGGGGTGGGGAPTTYTVKFETNGGSEISNIKVETGKTVGEPDEPTRDGYIFEGWYTDKELTKAYDFDTKVTKAITLYAKWTEKSTEPTTPPESTEWVNPFTDVKSSEWYYDSIKYAEQNGLMTGITDTIFAPEDNLTRAMLVTILYRAEGEPAVNKSIPFSDVAMDSYYANAVIWAKQNGIVSGHTEDEFAPDDNITREQIATIMYRYASYKGIAPKGAWAIRLDYADIAEVSDYAGAGVMYCTKDKIMTGKDNNMFCPKDYATRAEIAAILQRFIEKNK